MRMINRLGFITVLLCFTLSTKAQESSNAIQETTPTGFFIGGHASTGGWGFNARYAFNHWFSLKTGYETLNFSYGFDFDENDIEYDADLDFKAGGILALAEFSYAKNLYISAGVLFNQFKPEVRGYAVSDLEYGDIIIPAEDIGDFIITAKPGLVVSPYAGAGYQAFWGKNDGVVFNFEIGAYYQGPPEIEIEASGLLAPTADEIFNQAEYLEYQFDAYKIYPVVKFNLAFKLF